MVSSSGIDMEKAREESASATGRESSDGADVSGSMLEIVMNLRQSPTGTDGG